MKIKTFIVDSFTNTPFKGNPAGVCLLDEPLTVDTMQNIAAELNLSETAFVIKKEDNHFAIRYFTPTVEIDFCGHATLASAKIILDKMNYKSVDFTANKGLQLNAKLDGDFIKMLFPLYNTVTYSPNEKLKKAFGIGNPIAVRFSKDLDLLVIEVKNKQSLMDIHPNFQEALESSDEIKVVVITVKSTDKEYDFYSRCFVPWVGINEDPVTGAAHSVLAKYWGDALNKKEMSAYQLSKRGGFLNLKILNDEQLEVKSNAQIIFEGILNI